MEPTTIENLTILAPLNDPESLVAICIGEDQPLTDAHRGPLSKHELRMLEDNEHMIEQSIAGYLEIGRCLRVIQRGRLYREKYASFDEYCQKRWGFGRHRGYQLIKASELAEEMLTIGQHQAPSNERQHRDLLKLPDANARKRAMSRAEEIAGDEPMKPSHIKKAVAEQLEADEEDVIDVEVVQDPELDPLPEKKSNAVIKLTSAPDQETNEAAINRLFQQIREFAESKKWEPAFNDMLTELEQRIQSLVRAEVKEAA
jgi:hypothetical protein